MPTQNAIRAFSRNLDTLMKKQGLSQSDLARKVWGTSTDSRGYVVAKNRDMISSYLRGATAPTVSTLGRLARALGVTATALGGDLALPATDRDNPGFRLTAVAGDAKRMHLHIDLIVTTKAAAKILALLASPASSNVPPTEILDGLHTVKPDVLLTPSNRVGT